MASITIRIDDETRDKLIVAAEERGVAASAFVREVLEERFRMEGGEMLEERPKSTLELSLVERRILQLLHRVTLAAKGDLTEEWYNAEDEHRSIQVLSDGFTAEYEGQEFAGITSPMPQAEGELVWDILDMFRVVKFSVQKLGDDGWDQLGLEGAERHGSFQGFDLNDSSEVRMLGYTRYLVENGRWEEQREFVLGSGGGRGNSHRQMLPTYRDMLRAFKPRWQKTVRGFGHYLSKDDLRDVLLAGGAKNADGA